MRLFKSYHSRALRGKIYCGDALDLLTSLRSGVVELAFLDPPFNLGKDYGPASAASDRRGAYEYEAWLARVVDETVRILAPGGALFLYHVPLWGLRLGAHIERDLSLRHWIAVSMKNGFARGRRLYPAHYALLYFTKGEPRHFHRPRIQPLLCKSCGAPAKDYGGYRGIIDAKGINLSDVWEDISPVRHRGAKLRKANQLPIELTRRVMAMAGRPGYTLLDPFAGTGSTVAAACEIGMHFIACDVARASCSIMARRLERFSRFAQRRNS